MNEIDGASVILAYATEDYAQSVSIMCFQKTL